jgi:hypothetical protein
MSVTRDQGKETGHLMEIDAMRWPVFTAWQHYAAAISFPTAAAALKVSHSS